MISVAVRWYLRYGLSYQDVEELLAEHGVTVWLWRFRETALVCGTLRTRARAADMVGNLDRQSSCRCRA